MKKVFIQLFVLLISVLLMTACGKNDDVIRVSFMTWGSKTEIAITQKLIRNFEVEHPEIKINLIHVPSNYFQKLHMLIASNLAPDVIFINNINSKIYIEADKFVNLNEYIQKDAYFNKENFIEESFLPFEYKGGLYAIPRDISNLLIYYNKDLFDKHGVKYPDKNWDYDIFLKTAKSLTLDTNKDNKNDVFGFGFEKDSLFWLPILWSNGGGIVSDDLTKSIINTENSKRSLQFYSDLRNKYHVAPLPEEQSGLTTSQLFIQGKVAMHICGKWCSATYKKNVTFNWDVINLPNGTHGSISDLDGSGYAISASSKHKKEAWEFIKFMSSESSMKEINKSGLIVPVLKSVAYAKDDLDFIPEHGYIFTDIIKTSKTTAVPIKYGEINDLVNEKTEKIFESNYPVDDIINEDLDLKIEKLLK